MSITFAAFLRALKSHIARLRLAAEGGKRGRERAWRGEPAAPRSFSPLGVGWGTHVTTFETWEGPKHLLRGTMAA